MRLIWTDLAKANLKEIYDYYKEVASIKVAESIRRKLIKKPYLLTTNAEIGQIEENPLVKDRGFRYLVEGNYKIVYKLFPEVNEILILTVFDTRQNPTKVEL